MGTKKKTTRPGRFADLRISPGESVGAKWFRTPSNNDDDDDGDDGDDGDDW